MVEAALKKNLESPMSKQSDHSYLQGKSNIHFVVARKIDVVNKQLVSPLS